MPRRLYSLLLYLLLPAAIVWFGWRGWRHAAHRGSLKQRLGLELPLRAGRPLWLHAASLGELQALAALLHGMPDEGPLLVTVGTPTGVARARELFGADPRVQVQAAPWDLPGATRRFLDACRPRAAVFIETELWPNLIAAAQARGVPLWLVSARLSERSLRGYQRWAPAMMRAAVRAFAAIGTQGEADRARFIRLGAAQEVVSVTGNLKFDVPADPAIAARGADLRARWCRDRPLWVAGSTHAGEEAILVDAQRRLLAAAHARGAAAPLLVLVPRRPERFTLVARWLATQGLRCASTSGAGDGERQPVDIEVLLVDELGSLPPWYAAADAAFVGGSLVPVGGHNLLEPAVLGRPLLTGPHTFNAPDVAQSLLDAGGARLVRDAEELAARLTLWLGDPPAAAAAGGAAAMVVAEHRGAAQRARALLTARVPAPASARSATG